MAEYVEKKDAERLAFNHPYTAKEWISKLHSIDIVRCSECRYAKTCCQNVIDDPDGVPDKLYYCSHGER